VYAAELQLRTRIHKSRKAFEGLRRFWPKTRPHRANKEEFAWTRQTIPISNRWATSYGFSVSQVHIGFITENPSPGTIWFFTLGLFLIGWIIDLFLIPSMDRLADFRYQSGELDYTITWILLTFLGLFGIHRFYMGKWLSGILYLLTGGIFGLGYLYDLWTLNDQVSLINSGA
jgi:TM2 domain-containing membrane protein YozV